MHIFITRQLIYNYPEQLFADAGVMAIEHADFDGIERLALVTGGEIASTFDSPDRVKLGHCKVIEQVIFVILCSWVLVKKVLCWIKHKDIDAKISKILPMDTILFTIRLCCSYCSRTGAQVINKKNCSFY